MEMQQAIQIFFHIANFIKTIPIFNFSFGSDVKQAENIGN
jgi:hypothetical protein